MKLQMRIMSRTHLAYLFSRIAPLIVVNLDFIWKQISIATKWPLPIPGLKSLYKTVCILSHQLSICLKR